MYRKILAGTDGSDSASLALQHAVDLAERLQAELTVVTAHDEGPQSRPNAPAAIARALLRDVEETYRGRVALRTRAAEGAAAEVLIGLAATEGHDLLVVGNRGLGETPSLAPPSVPGAVSRRAAVAVLVADTIHRRPPGYTRILVGTDASATADRAVDQAIALGEALGAEVVMATVGSSEKDAKRAARALEDRWPAIQTLWKVGEPSEGLSDLAESGRYDLLVLGNKGMRGFRRALGNVPLRTLKRAPASLLIVQTTSRESAGGRPEEEER